MAKLFGKGKGQTQQKKKPLQKSTSFVVNIPDEPIEPNTVIEDFLILLYGPPKIGKSTFCSQFNDPVFIETEPGLKFKRVRKQKARNWEEFTAIIEYFEKKLEDGSLTCGCIIVDTIDNVYKWCLSYVCAGLGIDHPADLEWGKGWEALGREWHEWILRLSTMGVGVVFIGHSTEKEVTYRSMKITKTVPMLPSTAYRSINALVDFIFYAGFQEVKSKKTGKLLTKRVLYTKPTEYIEAGDRSSKLPDVMPFDFESFNEFFTEAQATG